ncbi:leucine-rich repeat domain-containing protein [Brachyspira innocens]|uniref:Leucine-rich repeat domain-containing protein n=1 Tax=Brachyspira innocens TaxID=13264 RepID=A0ABT8YX63_9SPIR|nr:leucine-rich repeat domain-containing protein [Brachyspira innocens]MDO6992778.1 leucine-rich repeat domain-containing protein [Brachyspira innocens]MDO7020140.1 leucine-rich repeat domain-containing protein [Brachyspira innocens]
MIKKILLILLSALVFVSCSAEIISPSGNSSSGGNGQSGDDTVPTEEELIAKYGIDIGLDDAVISQKIEENLKAYYEEMTSYRLIFTGIPKDYIGTAESLSILIVKSAMKVNNAKNIDIDIRNIDFQNETINTGMFSGETIDDSIIFNFIFPEDKIKTIASMSFDNLYNIREIILPDSITSIENYAFNNCQNIEKLTLGNGLKTIGDYAFLALEYLKELVIPNSVISIGIGAFAQSEAREKITIPASVKTIGMGAFLSCPNLTTVIYYGTSPTDINNNDALLYCYKLTTLIVPNADNPDDPAWKTFLGANFTTVKKQ